MFAYLYLYLYLCDGRSCAHQCTETKALNNSIVYITMAIISINSLFISLFSVVEFVSRLFLFCSYHFLCFLCLYAPLLPISMYVYYNRRFIFHCYLLKHVPKIWSKWRPHAEPKRKAEKIWRAHIRRKWNSSEGDRLIKDSSSKRHIKENRRRKSAAYSIKPMKAVRVNAYKPMTERKSLQNKHLTMCVLMCIHAHFNDI